MTNIIMMIFNKKVSIGINLLFLGLLMIPCSVYGIDFPDLPVLNIVTVNGEMPTSTIVYAPEGCSGVSITDNEYVPGRMIVTLKGNTLYDTKEYVKGESGMRIKIRGNSTGAYMNQHPYKIKLSKKYDLLERGDKSFKHKDWVLLSMYTWNVKMTNQESNILNIAGTIVSKALNKEWTPDFTFVNVVINDEYQGMYYLMESAERGDKRVIIDDTGFMIEDDTFWWNENIYFKTDYQKTNVAFTYKYPDDDDVTDSIQNIIRNYMNEFERVLYSKGDLSSYIDFESFAKWILIHDILGTDDAAGCNRFIYKYDYNKDNPYSSKLQMGPVWDYDSTFRSDDWSTLHTNEEWFYFTKLFERDDFRRVYLQLWQSIRPNILSDIQSGFDEIWNKYGDVFDESMKLHQTIYPNEGRQSFRSQIDEVIEKLTNRVYLLDNLMTQYGYTDNISITSDDSSLMDITDIYGRPLNSTDINRLSKGMYIFRYVNQNNKKVMIK